MQPRGADAQVVLHEGAHPACRCCPCFGLPCHFPGGVREQTEAPERCKWMAVQGRDGRTRTPLLKSSHAEGRVVHACMRERVVHPTAGCALHAGPASCCASAWLPCAAVFWPDPLAWLGWSCRAQVHTPHPLAQGIRAHAHHAAQRQNKPVVGTIVGPGWWVPVTAQMQWGPTRVPCRGWQPGCAGSWQPGCAGWGNLRPRGGAATGTRPHTAPA